MVLNFENACYGGTRNLHVVLIRHAANVCYRGNRGYTISRQSCYHGTLQENTSTPDNFSARSVQLVYTLYTGKCANACVVQPLPRRVRQESADTTAETFTAGNYAKIAERGCGQYQRFVSCFWPYSDDLPLAQPPFLSIRQELFRFSLLSTKLYLIHGTYLLLPVLSPIKLSLFGNSAKLWRCHPFLNILYRISCSFSMRMILA